MTHHLTVRDLRDRPPGQLPCGWYGLPPAHFGVLVNPTGAELNQNYKPGHVLVWLQVPPTGRVRVVMDLLWVSLHGFGPGPVPGDMTPLAEVAVLTAFWRSRVARRASDPGSDFYCPGPEWWECRTLRGDALALALVLVELWHDNPDGALALLPVWLDELPALCGSPKWAARTRRAQADLTDRLDALAASGGPLWTS